MREQGCLGAMRWRDGGDSSHGKIGALAVTGGMTPGLVGVCCHVRCVTGKPLKAVSCVEW